jgi:hypothetical protein
VITRIMRLTAERRTITVRESAEAMAARLNASEDGSAIVPWSALQTQTPADFRPRAP